MFYQHTGNYKQQYTGKYIPDDGLCSAACPAARNTIYRHRIQDCVDEDDKSDWPQEPKD